MLNFGFCGFRHGHIFSLYERVKSSPETAVVSAFEPDAPARKAAEEQGVVFNCSNYDDMLADKNIQVIAFGGAYGDRADAIKKAIVAGKHIISDKPFCISLEDLDEITALLKKHNVVLGCMFDLRTSANLYTAAKLIREGKIGEINGIQFNGMHPLNYGTRPSWYFEKGMHGGTINDIAIHLFDLLPSLTGHKVQKILASHSANINFPEVPYFTNAGVVMLTLDNGACVNGDVSYFAASFATPSYWRFTIGGSKGMIEFNYSDPGVLLMQHGCENCTVEPENAPFDYFDAFLSEVGGKKLSPCTEEILQTARWALLAQQAAN